jgi:hypothetical protein
MQTFLTSANSDPVEACRETFNMLDNARLGKQRLEAVQIIKNQFPNHPATKMWQGHKHALALYASFACIHWRERGKQDTLLPILDGAMRSARSPLVWPWWFGHPAFVRAHQTKLYWKGSPKWVAHLNEMAPRHQVMRMPYLWPDIEDEGVFRVSVAEAKRADWEIPSSWAYDHKTRVVIPR